MLFTAMSGQGGKSGESSRTIFTSQSTGSAVLYVAGPRVGTRESFTADFAPKILLLAVYAVVMVLQVLDSSKQFALFFTVWNGALEVGWEVQVSVILSDMNTKFY